MNQSNQKRNPPHVHGTGFLATNIARKYSQLQQLSTTSIEEILAKLKGVRRSGEGWIAFCPAHQDKRTRSFSIKETNDGYLLVHCFSGCTFVEIVASLGMNETDFFVKRL